MTLMIRSSLSLQDMPGNVKPPIMDTLIRGQPPYNGQTACPLPLTVHTFLPPTKGQPLNNGQNARPQRVHYSEVPLYMYTWCMSIRSVYLIVLTMKITSMSLLP